MFKALARLLRRNRSYRRRWLRRKLKSPGYTSYSPHELTLHAHSGTRH